VAESQKSACPPEFVFQNAGGKSEVGLSAGVRFSERRRKARSQPVRRSSFMKKKKADNGMLAEYDFSKGVRGKYAARFKSGTNIVVLEPDVAEVFSDSRLVNETLRAVARVARRPNLRPARRNAKRKDGRSKQALNENRRM
jgi:hypothetical protein